MSRQLETQTCVWMQPHTEFIHLFCVYYNEKKKKH